MFKAPAVWFWALCVIFAHAQAPAAAPQQTDNQAPPEPHVVEGRVKIDLKTERMTVAQNNKVALDLHGYAVSRILAEWRYQNTEESPEPFFQQFDPVSLQHAPGGATYVEVVPPRVGPIRLRLLVDFADGGAEDDSINLNVGLPDRDPDRFILVDFGGRADYNWKAGTLRLDFSPAFNKIRLTPVVFYKEVASPIPISFRSGIAVAVIPRKNGTSPITFDASTGTIKSLKVGQALLKATVHGKSAYVCADVMSDVREFNQRSNCNEFLPKNLPEPIDEPLGTPKLAGTN